MTRCFFVSDLHGHTDRYRKLFARILEDRPDVVFLGGDLLPHGIAFTPHDEDNGDFVSEILVTGFLDIRDRLGKDAPDVFLILGNDDGRFPEADIIEAAERGAWQYVHNRKVKLGKYTVYGYNYVPPTPFMNKDWERYDVSRYVDPGCIPPTEGKRSFPVDRHEVEYATIARDLQTLADDDDMTNAVCLFHSPPYKTNLDRVALDGKMVDHVPLDVHIGSIAMQRFITSRQPYLTLHGHAHESAHLTGSWQDKIGRTICYTAAHHGPELALITFELENPEAAIRELL